jgi:CubicO group peptidase (beta-lactamase class C family)
MAASALFASLRLHGVLLCCTLPARADLAGDIDQYLKAFAVGNNFTGIVLVQKGQSVIFEKPYGMANYELRVPNSVQTRFHIASLTKMFTAAAILLLEEEGKLRTSDSVAKFLPTYPHGANVTLEQLLTHTAGLPNAVFAPGERRIHYTAEQLVALVKDKPLDFPPGTKTQYSNSNYNLLAYIIEVVSGQSYGEFLRRRVLAPLHMPDTEDDDDASRLIANRATGTIPAGLTNFANAPWVDWSSTHGSGSLVSTARDLARFIRAEFTGEILSRQSLQKVTAKRSGFPYGWSQTTEEGRVIFAVGGRSPGFVSAVQYYPAEDITVIVLTNSYSSMAQDPIATDVANIVFGKRITSGPVQMVEPRAGQLSGIAGRYQLPPSYYAPNAIVTLVECNKYFEAHWEQGAVNAIYPVSAEEFIDRGYWARVRFHRDKAGTVTGFSYHLVSDFEAKRLPSAK